MSSRFSAHRLLGTTSMLALSAGAILATAMIQPAAAATPAGGLWGGGSSLSSLTARQIFDCYAGTSISPSVCTTPVAGAVEGLFAAVGSGRGQQAFIAHDQLQLLNGGGVPLAGLPAVPPPFIDSASASPSFNGYPYPGISFAASDNPLPTSLTTAAFTFTGLSTAGWAPGNVSGSVSVGNPTTVTYSTANFGPAIQLPLFEVPVAIAVNTSGLDGLQSNAVAPASTSDAGGAIQLSTAQVCAIFSGTVTDWNSTASISAFDNTGTLTTLPFSDANRSTTDSAKQTPQAYASSSVPIRVTYRADSSGTSFIFTNYLQASCLPLATAGNKYATIFGAAGLPSTTFSTLVSAVTTAGNSAANWQSATGSGGVATAIGTAAGSTTSGAIGYLSADFTTPYDATSGVVNAPHSASVQNEDQRATNISHPAVGVSFIAPTPAGADLAYSALTGNATIPNTTDYNGWNIYNYTYASGTLSGKSILGIPNTTDAYPVAGTTFIDLYSCYANAATDVTNFLKWYYNNGNSSSVALTSTTLTPNATVAAVLQNNGFNPLHPAVAASLFNEYLLTGATAGISATGSSSPNASCRRASGA